ncbi:MAG: STAS domain-containing protein [Solirubrobacterales bacterium]
MALPYPQDEREYAFEISPSAGPDGAVRLRVRGELDMATAEAFEPALERAIDSTDGPVVVDFAQCRFVDSIGVRALIRGARRLAEAGRVMRVVGAHAQVCDLFRTIGLEQATAIEFGD